MPTVADIAGYLNSFAPISRAAEWDNVGLLLGEESAAVQRVLTCLTVTPEVVDEAVQTGVNLIVTHHPMMFRPVKKITDQDPAGRMLLALLKAGVAVYSPHTAFDNCVGGINDMLAAKLGLVEVASLRPFESARQCKIVVFVPQSDLAKVMDAMFAAGAGVIGQYRECSFRLSGTGTFFGSEETNPTVGRKGRREEVSEWRLELVCPEAKLAGVITAMRKAHSYEEPAFDVYPLQPGRETNGEGRIGFLPDGLPLGDFARRVRGELKCGPVQVVGEVDRPIQRVALACGAAGEFLQDAIRQGADLFLCGEIRFHDCLKAIASNISLILPGHYATERFGIEALAFQLAQVFAELAVTASQSERDPVAWV